MTSKAQRRDKIKGISVKIIHVCKDRSIQLNKNNNHTYIHHIDLTRWEKDTAALLNAVRSTKWASVMRCWLVTDGMSKARRPSSNGQKGQCWPFNTTWLRSTRNAAHRLFHCCDVTFGVKCCVLIKDCKNRVKVWWLKMCLLTRQSSHRTLQYMGLASPWRHTSRVRSHAFCLMMEPQIHHTAQINPLTLRPASPGTELKKYPHRARTHTIQQRRHTTRNSIIFKAEFNVKLQDSVCSLSCL